MVWIALIVVLALAAQGAPPRLANANADGGEWAADGHGIWFERDDDVWFMFADGAGESCFTCGHRDLPPRAIRSPVAHPSGRYLLVEAVDTFPLPAPTELWAMDLGSGRANRLTKPGAGHATHARFSQDGARLLWTERGNRLAIATFATRPVPRLIGFETFDAGVVQSAGWGPGDEWIYYSCAPDGGALDVCTMFVGDPRTVASLTRSPGEHDELARLSPDGRRFVWASTAPYGTLLRRTDLWVMDVDGHFRRRLTFFNDEITPDKGTHAVISDVAWRPDGRSVMVSVRFPTGGPPRMYAVPT